MAEKYCVLVDGKLCDDCGECQRCDLDPSKICDNCMKCVNTGADYNAVQIDGVITDGAQPATDELEGLGSASTSFGTARASARWRSGR